MLEDCISCGSHCCVSRGIGIGYHRQVIGLVAALDGDERIVDSCLHVCQIHKSRCHRNPAHRHWHTGHGGGLEDLLGDGVPFRYAVARQGAVGVVGMAEVPRRVTGHRHPCRAHLIEQETGFSRALSSRFAILGSDLPFLLLLDASSFFGVALLDFLLLRQILLWVGTVLREGDGGQASQQNGSQQQDGQQTL
ncbi:MAG: hypothetical protein BWY63_01426 [Chloroflexi bacterium ADurb.Bin360]|nr:MAG: hypothetical protein BWY63_01426 [Chloroflexi bacterium ADurb.Bin360]